MGRGGGGEGVTSAHLCTTQHDGRSLEEALLHVICTLYHGLSSTELRNLPLVLVCMAFIGEEGRREGEGGMEEGGREKRGRKEGGSRKGGGREKGRGRGEKGGGRREGEGEKGGGRGRREGEGGTGREGERMINDEKEYSGIGIGIHLVLLWR